MRYPFSLLYHQTMSILASQGELSPSALAEQVLTLPPFQAISQPDFRQLLRHLIEIDQIEKTPEGGLIIGLQGEKIARNFKFYAIFPDAEDYVVKRDGKAIGSIVVPPSEGDRISLAGRVWEVLEVDAKKKVIAVQASQKTATSSSWRGSAGEIHTRVLQRMRQILLETTHYSYLQEGAQKRLQLAREMARNSGLLNHPIVLLDEELCCIFPWAGTTAFRTLERFLRFYCKGALGLKSIKTRSPYFIIIRLGKCKLESLESELRSFGAAWSESQLDSKTINTDELLDPDEVPKLQKYDELVPPDLLRKSFIVDYLNLQELGKIIQRW
jgi:ATP-dependent Lhr-like helicase